MRRLLMKLLFKDYIKMKQSYYDMQDIILSYGVFTDLNGKLNGDKNFDSKWVESKWDKHYELDTEIRDFLRKY